MNQTNRPENDQQRHLQKLIAKNPGVLKHSQLETIRRDLGDIVPRGHYTGPGSGVRVLGIESDPKLDSPTLSDFYVKFERLANGEEGRCAIGTFLNEYRPIATDII